MATARFRFTPAPLVLLMCTVSCSRCTKAELTWDVCVGKESKFTDPHGNGRQLLGVGFLVPPKEAGKPPVFVGVESIDAKTAIDQDGHKITDIEIVDHELTGVVSRRGRRETIKGGAWHGATFSGQVRCPSNVDQVFPVSLHVTQVTAPDANTQLAGRPPPSAMFGLELDSPDPGKPALAACQKPNDGTDDYKNGALPVGGYWDSSGKYIDGAHEKLSFACLNNIVAKCLYLGYPSADQGPDKGPLFQACTRVGRADYCGNGHSFTKDGTEVKLKDTAAVVSERIPDALRFEGMWNSHGAACLDHRRWQLEDIEPRKEVRDSEEFQALVACLNNLPACHSEREAATQLNGSADPLISSYSCPQHPCDREPPALVSSDAQQ